MPIGNYWPSMSWELHVGNKNLNTTSDWLTYLKDPSSWCYRQRDSSTCREILSCTITGVMNRHGRTLLEYVTPSTPYECSITISKEVPSSLWMQAWMNNFVWPNLFGEVSTPSSNIKVTIPRASLIEHFANEAPLSYSLFFLNRHQDFPLNVISNPMKCVEHVLSKGESWFGGSTRLGSNSVVTAYVIYYLNKRGIGGYGNLFKERGISSNGLVSYAINSSFILKTANTFAEFINEFPKYGIRSHLEELSTYGEVSLPGVVDYFLKNKNEQKVNTWK
jgi:hypothetical protein